MDTVGPRTVKDRIEEARFDGIFVLCTNAKVTPLLKALGIAAAAGAPGVVPRAPEFPGFGFLINRLAEFRV